MNAIFSRFFYVTSYALAIVSKMFCLHHKTVCIDASRQKNYCSTDEPKQIFTEFVDISQAAVCRLGIMHFIWFLCLADRRYFIIDCAFQSSSMHLIEFTCSLFYWMKKWFLFRFFALISTQIDAPHVSSIIK